MDTVLLVGAEQVQSASHTIREAAHSMKQTASHIDYLLQQQRQFLDDWLLRFENILKDSNELHR